MEFLDYKMGKFPVILKDDPPYSDEINLNLDQGNRDVFFDDVQESSCDDAGSDGTRGNC